MEIGSRVYVPQEGTRFVERITNAVYLGGGVIRYTHNLGHNRFTALCVANRLHDNCGCVNFTAYTPTSTTFDVLTTDSRTGRPIDFSEYDIMLLGDN